MADVLFFLLLEDGAYLLQEDGVSRLILEEGSIWGAKVCGMELAAAGGAPLGSGPHSADQPLSASARYAFRPAQELAAQASPATAAPTPRVGVKMCSSALPVDGDTSLADWLRARGRT
jgi:hypothetical protein